MPRQLVTITNATPGAVMHYTTNGAVPTINDPVIASGGTVVAGFYTLKAQSFLSGWTSSDIASATYAITSGFTNWAVDGSASARSRSRTMGPCGPGEATPVSGSATPSAGRPRRWSTASPAWCRSAGRAAHARPAVGRYRMGVGRQHVGHARRQHDDVACDLRASHRTIVGNSDCGGLVLFGGGEERRHRVDVGRQLVRATRRRDQHAAECPDPSDGPHGRRRRGRRRVAHGDQKG